MALGYTVPFRSVHAGKYRRQIRNTDNTQLHKLNTTHKKANKTTMVQLLLTHDTWPGNEVDSFYDAPEATQNVSGSVK